MPALIVAAALVFHALHNALPLFTLIALVSAAYGRLAWHDFLQSKMISGSVTESVTEQLDRSDTTLGVEPTR